MAVRRVRVRHAPVAAVPRDSAEDAELEERVARVEELERRIKAREAPPREAPLAGPAGGRAGGDASSLYAKAPTPAEWEALSGTEKIWNIWAREKGILWYINQSAYYSVGILIVAWIVFRFIGPATGLYTLD